MRALMEDIVSGRRAWPASLLSVAAGIVGAALLGLVG